MCPLLWYWESFCFHKGTIYLLIHQVFLALLWHTLRGISLPFWHPWCVVLNCLSQLFSQHIRACIADFIIVSWDVFIGERKPAEQSISMFVLKYVCCRWQFFGFFSYVEIIRNVLFSNIQSFILQNYKGELWSQCEFPEVTAVKLVRLTREIWKKSFLFTPNCKYSGNRVSKGLLTGVKCYPKKYLSRCFFKVQWKN